MVKYESNCSGCYDSGGYCVGFCPHKEFPVFYCDICDESTDELYDFYGSQVCRDCLLKESLIPEAELIEE